MAPKLTMVDMLPTVVAVTSLGVGESASALSICGHRHPFNCWHYVHNPCNYCFYRCSGYDSGFFDDWDFDLLYAQTQMWRWW